MNAINGTIVIEQNSITGVSTIITLRETLEKLATTLGYNFKWVQGGILLYKGNADKGFYIEYTVGIGSNNASSAYIYLKIYDGGTTITICRFKSYIEQGTSETFEDGTWKRSFTHKITFPYVLNGNTIAFGVGDNIYCCSSIGKKIISGKSVWCHIYENVSYLDDYTLGYGKAYLFFVAFSDECGRIEWNGTSTSEDYKNNAVAHLKSRAGQQMTILSPCYIRGEEIQIENVYITEKFIQIKNTIEFEMNGCTFVSSATGGDNGTGYDAPRFVVRSG